MKKTLFSLAFVAASGIYIAAANHFVDVPGAEQNGLAEADPASRSAAPAAVEPSALATAPTTAPKRDVTANPDPAPAEVVSNPAPIIRPKPAELPVTAAQAAPATAIVPPLPRPRPTAPTSAVVQTQVATSGTGGYRDGTYTGSSANAYYGRVQVQITIASQHIASVKVLDFPQDRRTSRYINSQALPLLRQEVMAADSANVDVVSGATLTSEAYIRSLSNALGQAGAANA